ncbi:S-adenosyl-L-methionine-dependent methyltransferase [Martensiomyces pterosporus]|nr:S-adenosyl-L-methionine-dependent methyltransferase [Martensiomyces pterosporus]
MKKAAPIFAALPAATARGLSVATAQRQHQPASPGTELPAESKAQAMSDVYWNVAEEYSRVCYFISLGRDPVFKNIFVKKMAPSPGERMLDVAGGTCEVTRRYLKYQDEVNGDRTSTVHVVDFNPGMLSVGKRRLADTQWMRDGRVTFAQGDAENLADIPDNSFDAYTISLGMHNLENKDKALAEAYRVLKPGGRFACMEYGVVELPVLRTVIDWYWDHALPYVIRALTSNHAAFLKMARSGRAFPHQHEFVKTIRNAGFYCHGQGYEAIRYGSAIAYFGIKPTYTPEKE